jgi:phage baseplate assembly protein W
MAFQISRAFKDISLSFKRHPVTNDLIMIKNENAIKTSVINLVRTYIGERFFRSDIGTPISRSLFEVQIPEFGIEVENHITQTLVNLEPRIQLKKVNVSFPLDKNELSVDISYDIIGLAFPIQELTFVLNPTRI